jgi:hypothetical protein
VSLADDVDAERPARVVAERPPKILTLDIERVPGRATVKHRGLTVEGDFWDLSGWKHTIGRRIHADDVTEWPRTICLAWRWYGNKRVEFAAEWLTDHEAMLRTAWDLFHQADIVVGHNMDGFDAKTLAGEWWATCGLTKPSPWKSVDTLKVARSQFRLESNTLDALLHRAGLGGKTDRYSVEMARAACGGDRKAQRKLRAYNVGDIDASETLYDAVRGWIPNHPHIGLWSGDEDCCGSCGGELKASDWCRTAVTAYAQYRCVNCGAWYRRNDVKMRTRTRPAR